MDIKKWIVSHKVASIVIAAGATAVIATSVIVPVAVSNAKVEITWKDDAGNVLRTDTVKKGDMPSYGEENPTKATTAQYSYTFAGWEPEIVAAKETAVYTAKFNSSVRKYDVKFVDDLGNVLKNENLEYSATPTAPENPLPEDTAEWDYISFDGWDKAISQVDGDQTYTGIYTKEKQKYTVSWVDEDLSELETDTNVPYGTVPSFDGSEPTKAGDAQYTWSFTGWDKDDSAPITGNITFVAQYASTVNKYKVSWYNPDGELLEEDMVPYGTVPTFGGGTPSYPVAHYTSTFSGWDKDTTVAITGNKSFTANYDLVPDKYTAKFYNYDRTTLLDTVENVDYNVDCRSSYSGATPTKASDGVSTFTFYKFKELPIDHANKVRSFVAEYKIETPSEYFAFELVGSDYYKVTGFADGKYTDEIGIPSSYNDKPVKTIYNSAFYLKGIKSVYIPKSITTLGDSCFRSCGNLKTVTFESGGTQDLNISYKLFYGSQVDGILELPSQMLFGNWSSYSFELMPYVTGFAIADQPSTPTYNFCEDGVFYSDYGKTIVAYPSGKTDTKYVAKSTVTDFGDYVCFTNSYLTEINFTTSSGQMNLDSYFCNCPNLEKMTFNMGCTVRLYWYPIVEGKLTSLLLPKTILRSKAFAQLGASETKPVDVFISGKVGDWAADWYDLKSDYVNVYLYSEDSAIDEGELPTKIAGSWHYVDSVPTVWEA